MDVAQLIKQSEDLLNQLKLELDPDLNKFDKDMIRTHNLNVTKYKEEKERVKASTETPEIMLECIIERFETTLKVFNPDGPRIHPSQKIVSRNVASILVGTVDLSSVKNYVDGLLRDAAFLINDSLISSIHSDVKRTQNFILIGWVAYLKDEGTDDNRLYRKVQ